MLVMGCQLAPDRATGTGQDSNPGPVKGRPVDALLNLRVTEQGVGGIRPGLLFRADVVRQALPGFEILPQTWITEGEQYPVLDALLEETRVLTVVPDSSHRRVGAVWIHDSRVLDLLGHSVGARFETIYARGAVGDCRRGPEEYSGAVICQAPASNHLSYLFQGYWDGPDDQLPPEERMATWVLSQIIWLAGGLENR